MASIWKNQLPFIRHVRQREWPVWGGATADSLWLKPCQAIVPVAVLKKTHFNHTIARCWNGSCIDSRADVGFVCGTIPHHLATVAKTQPSLTDTWFQAQTRNPKWVFMLTLKSWTYKRNWVRRMRAGRAKMRPVRRESTAHNAANRLTMFACDCSISSLPKYNKNASCLDGHACHGWHIATC